MSYYYYYCWCLRPTTTHVPPSEEDGSTLDSCSIAQAKKSVSDHRWISILLGDLNVDLDNIGYNIDYIERKTDGKSSTPLGLTSIRNHFCQRKKLFLGRDENWNQVREGVRYSAIYDHFFKMTRSHLPD